MRHFNLSGKIKFHLIDLLRGTSILKTLNTLRREQYLPAGQLEKIRQKKLEQLFRLAQSTAPYYRRYAAYSELPALTKDVVRESPDDFMSLSYRKKLIKKTTGGSTGEPFSYYNTHLTQSYMWAGLVLSWEAAGYRFGDRVAFVAGSSIIKSGWQYRLFYYLMNVDLLYASPLNDQVMSAYVQQLQQNKTAIIYGYANTIHTIANYIIRQGVASFPHLKGVVCTAEILSPSARTNIQQAFGVKVHDQYGCNEAGISAFECEQGNMHLISTRCVYETDSNDTLLGTDLVNEGFIMLKFNTADLVKFASHDCTCKRSFPIIQSVVGRQNDVVVDMDNNILHASFFGIVFSKDISIKQFQISYTDDSIELNIHGNGENYKPKYLPLLRHHATFKHYSLKINAPFIISKNGKHKEVVDNRKSSGEKLHGS